MLKDCKGRTLKEGIETVFTPDFNEVQLEVGEVLRPAVLVVVAQKVELMLLKSRPLNSPPLARSDRHTTLTVGGFIAVVFANA